MIKKTELNRFARYLIKKGLTYKGKKINSLSISKQKKHYMAFIQVDNSKFAYLLYLNEWIFDKDKELLSVLSGSGATYFNEEWIQKSTALACKVIIQTAESDIYEGYLDYLIDITVRKEPKAKNYPQ